MACALKAIKVMFYRSKPFSWQQRFVMKKRAAVEIYMSVPVEHVGL